MMFPIINTISLESWKMYALKSGIWCQWCVKGTLSSVISSQLNNPSPNLSLLVVPDSIVKLIIPKEIN